MADDNRVRDVANSAFLDYYRCPEMFADFTLSGSLSGTSGYFRFGPDAICYGRCAGMAPAGHPTDQLHDALEDVTAEATTLRLSFNPTEIVTNLRYERYISSADETQGRRFLHQTYYQIRPLLPVPVRKHLQRIELRKWRQIGFPDWPVDLTVENIFAKLLALLLERPSIGRIPFIWFWPNGASSCAIMTHDVETLAGRDFCSSLMDLNDAYGIKASFQIIPESRYEVPRSFLDQIRRREFEIGVHDLNHDGLLFRDRERFLLRAERINQYGQEYGACGFRAGALYHNLDWYGALNFSYDMSIPSVGHLEAQRGGCCSVMPFFVGRILELPVTVVQDYSLFNILGEYSTALWKCQVAQIMEHHGLASFIAHPDYLQEVRARGAYESLLAYLADLRSQGKIWIALPGEVNKWWRARSQMKLVRHGNDWVIDGPESDKARVAYAILEGGRLTYEFEYQRRTALSRPEEQSKSEVVKCVPSRLALR